jgi:hypothetical protein
MPFRKTDNTELSPPEKARTIHTENMAMQLRLTAILPLAFSAISFALSLVLLLAGSKPGYLVNDFLVSVRRIPTHIPFHTANLIHIS